MLKTVEMDIAIIGGGIAGLWLLNRLCRMGFSAILLESDHLGGGQTTRSQGIIHGGMKYALQGKLTKAAKAIANMPTVWKECLQGTGEINLANVPILSTKQYLWSTGSLSGTIAGFFAGMTLKSETRALNRELFPAVFQHPQFQGQVYALDEIVVDTISLVRELAAPLQKVIFKIDSLSTELNSDDSLASLIVNDTFQIKAKKYIFSAGSGNELLLKKLNHPTIQMQRRPLHMVIVKHDFDISLYAHCLGLGSTPRVTITSHRAQDGKWVWYLGGQLAEEGIKRTTQEQIEFTKKELRELFPWLDFSNAHIASFFIDRAENRMPNGARPDSYFFKEIMNMIVAWPTKLAFAPQLANEIIQHLIQTNIKPEKADLSEFNLKTPDIAIPVWDQ